MSNNFEEDPFVFANQFNMNRSSIGKDPEIWKPIINMSRIEKIQALPCLAEKVGNKHTQN